MQQLALPLESPAESVARSFFARGYQAGLEYKLHQKTPGELFDQDYRHYHQLILALEAPASGEKQ